ncbi:MAG: DnaJ domain-containing protein, partial [Cyanobacteria bacterium]|nr:DnaJ domain-containing protein [Cyanobacteriota bacterium]
YYQILELSPDVSLDEIHQAYRALAKKYHPDLFHLSKHKSRISERMQEINEAYSVLSSQPLRQAYDAKFHEKYSGNHHAFHSDSLKETIQQASNPMKRVLYYAGLVIFLFLIFRTSLQLILISPIGKVLLLVPILWMAYRFVGRKFHWKH